VNKIISLPYGIVDLAIAEGWTKQLAYYCHISMLHGNKIIYNYNSRKLAKKLNKSHGTVNTHVQFLIDKGLLSFKDGHLFCANQKELRNLVVRFKLKETGYGLLKIKVHSKILHTEWNINARVVINSLKQQKHVSRIKSEVNAISKKLETKAYVSKKDFKRYRKLTNSNNKTEKGTGENVCYLSDQTVGKLLMGRSTSNVRDMFEFWVQQGLVQLTLVKGRVLDTHINQRSYEALKEARFEFKKTYLYRGRIIEYNKRSINLGFCILANSI